MALIDILKAKGYSDADIEAMKPMLSDQRFVSTLEGELSAVSADRDKFRTEAETYANWHKTTAIPQIDKYALEATNARTEAARLREENRIAKEYGYLPTDPSAGDPGKQPVPQNQPAAPAAWDAKTHNVPTWDDVNKLADSEGRAIVMAQDLSDEYRELFGKSLISYTSGDGSRGMQALRAEAQATKTDLYTHVSRKFDFAGRRAAIAQDQRAKEDETVRADERAKMAAQYGNPELRQPMTSRASFMPKREGATGMPWEKNTAELRTARVTRAMQTELSGRTQ